MSDPKPTNTQLPSHHLIISFASPHHTNHLSIQALLEPTILQLSSDHPIQQTMATSSLVSAPTFIPTTSNSRQSIFTPSSISFQGLRPTATRLSAAAAPSPSMHHRRSAIIKSELNPSLVISLSTGLSLFLGRFVFFNFQRENVAKQGLPQQNGVTHFEAGDTRAKEYVSLLKSNDPVGFNIVDVLAWGSIGHIVAYYILATSSNGYDPNFFG